MLLNDGIGSAFVKSLESFGRRADYRRGRGSCKRPKCSAKKRSVTALGDDYGMAAGEVKDVLSFALTLPQREALGQELNGLVRTENRNDSNSDVLVGRFFRHSVIQYSFFGAIGVRRDNLRVPIP